MDFPIYTILLFAGLFYGMITFLFELRHYKTTLQIRQMILSIIIMIVSVIGLYIAY